MQITFLSGYTGHLVIKPFAVYAGVSFFNAYLIYLFI